MIMKAMILNQTIDKIRENHTPLERKEVDVPDPSDNEILVKVSVCGVCHTELDEIEGRTPPPELPVIPGHQVVGTVEKTGSQAHKYSIGDRVGVAWIYSACGECEYCQRGEENLCPYFRATGRDADGGYAEYMTVSQDYAYSIPEVFSDTDAAPLLCGGSVGYRALRLTELQNGQSLGFTGFGGSGHLVIQMALHMFPDSKCYVFTINKRERQLAMDLGATWAGDIPEAPPEKLDAIIDTTPVWKPMVKALTYLNPGGRLVINNIRKVDSDKETLLDMKFHTHLWMEKEIKSVANVTRKDVREFLELAAEIPIKPDAGTYSLEDANQALVDITQGKGRRAKVLIVHS